MKTISESDIEALGISPKTCVEWVEESFRLKPTADMPAKISVHPFADSFYTAMPCYHSAFGKVGVKVISRVPGSVPALKSKLMLYDARSGELEALVDTNWITAMRTGAAAALAAKTFAADFERASFGFVGLGTIGVAALRCLLAIHSGKPEIWLLRYKDHAERVQREFPDVSFHVAETREELIARTTVLVSAVTVMHEQFAAADAYPPGYTVIPIHVRGFQDCDVAFDRVIGDDAAHLRDWCNFSRFPRFTEFSDVLLGKAPARGSAAERILVYNYGLAIHDLLYVSKIINLIEAK